jgi:hypothetical protein
MTEPLHCCLLRPRREPLSLSFSLQGVRGRVCQGYSEKRERQTCSRPRAAHAALQVRASQPEQGQKSDGSGIHFGRLRRMWDNPFVIFSDLSLLPLVRRSSEKLLLLLLLLLQGDLKLLVKEPALIMPISEGDSAAKVGEQVVRARLRELDLMLVQVLLLFLLLVHVE